MNRKTSVRAVTASRGVIFCVMKRQPTVTLFQKGQLRTRQRLYWWCYFWIFNWNNGNTNRNNVTNNNYVRAFSEFHWQGNRLKGYMIIDEDMTRDELYAGLLQAYLACRKNKRNKHSALEFEANWMQDLEKLTDALYDRTYEIGPSTAFIVTRPKLREVFAASFVDRIVHHYITQRLEPLFEQELIEDTYNCRKGKGTLYGVKRVYDMVRDASQGYSVQDCYIAKFDMQGFFMSIHKPTLLRKLLDFMETRYAGEDKDLLAWLVEKVVMNCPEKNCIRRSRVSMWDGLPPDKSLFTVGDEYGLPIGNITSQMFANFYLSDFDHLMKDKFGYYGRYVDDFVVICRDKKEILQFIPTMQQELGKLHVRLHPRKIYLQHYSKGLSFIGSGMRMDRLYAGKRVVRNFHCAVRQMNGLSGKERCVAQFVSAINSYLGFLGHYRSYGIRRRQLGAIHPDWWRYVYISGHHEKLVCKKRFRIDTAVKSRVARLYNKTKIYHHGKNNRT